MSSTTFRIVACTIFIASVLLGGCSSGQSTPTATAPATVADAKNLKNPVQPTAKSLENGKRLYTRLCAECHGASGDGVSETATMLIQSGKIAPSNLIDDVWDLGSSDGEIFTVIRDGSGSNMKGLNGRPGIVDEDMWNLVNYVRSLHK